MFGVRKMASKTAGSSLWLQTLSQWSCPWTPGENKFLSFSENFQKKTYDVEQCREGKWEQSTVIILSMWTNNAWLNRTSILQTWPVGSNQKALGRGIQARRQIFLILVTLEILEIFLQSTHTYDTRQTNRKEKKICIGSTNWQKLTASVPLNLAQCLSHPKPKERKWERKATDAPCVPPCSQQVVIWKITFLFIPEKSRSAASIVNTNA